MKYNIYLSLAPKALRRMLEHEREHTAHIREVLGAVQNSFYHPLPN